VALRRVTKENYQINLSQRRKAGLTQNQLWWRSGVHYTEVSRLERGRRNPSWEQMKKIAKGLGVPCWEMVKHAEDLEREQAESEKRERPGS